MIPAAVEEVCDFTRFTAETVDIRPLLNSWWSAVGVVDVSTKPWTLLGSGTYRKIAVPTQGSISLLYQVVYPAAAFLVAEADCWPITGSATTEDAMVAEVGRGF